MASTVTFERAEKSLSLKVNEFKLSNPKNREKKKSEEKQRHTIIKRLKDKEKKS